LVKGESSQQFYSSPGFLRFVIIGMKLLDSNEIFMWPFSCFGEIWSLILKTFLAKLNVEQIISMAKGGNEFFFSPIAANGRMQL